MHKDMQTETIYNNEDDEVHALNNYELFNHSVQPVEV